MKRYLILFEGRVQGVGFRYHCQATAVQYHLTGYAQNLLNGNVQVEIQGEDESLSSFLSQIYKGNRFIHIEDYSIKELPIEKNETSFRIKY